ncbi:MAG: cyclic nucleotide-binding domain-containing protein [Candidatus Ornithospirochaeta sp.]|nr:cyclic nucleotide-binding domain-containing protein [Candidatus Ornithospirochaeta sp.]
MPSILEFSKGDVIYREGSFEMAMYRIVKGRISVIADYGKESEMLFVKEKEGEYFGHLELIEAIPRSASVIADEDTVLERITGEEFGSYLAEHPEEGPLILMQMSARLREIGDQLHEVYLTIDEYISEDSSHDESFFNRLARIIRLGRSARIL